ncbi:unnamed protein product, partial [Symbiodinium pilosum]
VWNDREHPGLVDPTQAFVFCSNIADLFTHFFVIFLSPPVFEIEIAQALMISAYQMLASLVNYDRYQSFESFCQRRFRCGSPVLGMHLIRNFHDWIPWSLRLLDFWSR